MRHVFISGHIHSFTVEKKSILVGSKELEVDWQHTVAPPIFRFMKSHSPISLVSVTMDA
uniref:Uncharacterized protein n=1 Tax=Anguilla anguilla TaxID=7936 RepID=A0A0E9SGL9_ANGAN